MPSRRGKSKRRQKSKLRSQSQHLEEQKPVLQQQSIEKKEETEEKLEDSSPKKSVLLEHYARTVQQRSLVEVALLCLLFNSNEIMASSWKLGDLSKSLFGFLLGGKNDDQNDNSNKKEETLPIKNSYSSSPSKPAAAKVVQETPQTMPRRKKRTSELQKETPPKQLLQKSLKDKEVKDENESSNTGGRESCNEDSSGFVTAPPKPAVEQLRNSLLVTDISSELTSNSKGEEEENFPALPPSSVSRKSSTHEGEAEETVIKNELSESKTENCQEFEGQQPQDEEENLTIVVLPSSTTVKKTEVLTTEMTEISDKKEDNDAFTHDCNLNNPQNTSDLFEQPSSSKAAAAEAMIPAPPPPPPPGFLAPEKTSSALKNEKEKEKLPKVSPAEKALLRQLESIDDPTFKSFLSGQLKVKSSSRERREMANEM